MNVEDFKDELDSELQCEFGVTLEDCNLSEEDIESLMDEPAYCAAHTVASWEGLRPKTANGGY